jgi:hypothetical protein
MNNRRLRRSQDNVAIASVACVKCRESTRAWSRKELDKVDVRHMQMDLLLEAVIDKIRGAKCRRTIRTLWLNQWDKKATAIEIGVSVKAISVALCRFKKAAAQIAAAPEFQEAYDRVFC